MDKIFENAKIKQHVRAISSKSEAHRALICSALADAPCFIKCTDTNADIDATAACLCALGAVIERRTEGFAVAPIGSVTKKASLDCNESGSTLRFLLPLAASLGADCDFIMRGRLAQRPLSPLYELMEQNGVILTPQGSNPLKIKGKLGRGNYCLAANVSSQYISGLLFALCIAEGDSTLTLDGNIESAPYIFMTVNTLIAFGADVKFDSSTNTFNIKGKPRLSAPSRFTVGGDWSNAAFFLTAGAIGKRPVTVSGLDRGSAQGDRAVLDVLCRMGARITFDDGITVHHSTLHGTNIDASDIPDLVPILAVAASVAQGKTQIYGAARLRLKESDRIESVCATLSALGAKICATEDGMIIEGLPNLSGGEADSFNDHRIAMSAAIASLVCTDAVTISRFEAINKSYPSFLENFE